LSAAGQHWNVSAAEAARFWARFLTTIGILYLILSIVGALGVLADTARRVSPLTGFPTGPDFGTAILLVVSGVIVFGFFAACASLLNVQADASETLRSISQKLNQR
jgi:TRAP-type C4-dicarboxylate transport system permease small subunit